MAFTDASRFHQWPGVSIYSGLGTVGRYFQKPYPRQLYCIRTCSFTMPPFIQRVSSMSYKCTLVHQSCTSSLVSLSEPVHASAPSVPFPSPSLSTMALFTLTRNLSLLCFLLAISIASSVHALSLPTSKRPFEEGQYLTNADRLKHGLSPLRPRVLYEPSRV